MTLQRLSRKLGQGSLVNDTFIKFFSNLAEVFDTHNCQCQDIYKVDKTAVITVIKTTRMAAKKDVK
jgi:precorrin-4 methylase